MKKFQVIINIQNSAIIKGTDKKKDVRDWVKAFMEKGVGTMSVYERNDIGAYDLADRHTFPDMTEPKERIIGFERW